MRTISLSGWNLVIAGGDAREIVLAEALRAANAAVWLYGFEQYEEPEGISVGRGFPEKADAVILPLPGVDKNGRIYAPFAARPLYLRELQPLLRPGLHILCGKMPASCEQELRAQSVVVTQTAEMDQLAIYNAVPTAEGAVEMAMRESRITIAGSRALVVGFGRCGLPLARLLSAMDARVTVAARRGEVLALAETMGFAAVTFENLAEVMGEFDFIFNSVPALVLGEGELSAVKKSALVIDIASAPGGTDFAAAERLGLKSFLALGLPGKVAPQSAGMVLAKVYPALLLSLTGKGGESK